VTQGFVLNRAPDPAERYRSKLAYPTDQVIVGYVHGKIEAAFLDCLDTMRQADALYGVGRFRDPWRLARPSGANLTLARNQLVRDFLATDAPWLLMVDTDMTWEADACERLLQYAAPDRIVGGLCFTHGPGGRIIPTIFDQDADGLHAYWPEGEPIPENTLQPVYGTGAAFLLVHRDALVRIAEETPGPECWFREVDRIHPTRGYCWTSEDLFFCDRAAAAGISIFVHTGVEVGHVKPVVLNRRLFELAETMLTWG
jgi:hypothetical protein